MNEENKCIGESRRISVFSDTLEKDTNELYTEDSLSKFEAVPLTTDHSCNVDREQRRVLEYGGRIDTVSSSKSFLVLGLIRAYF